jgi:hypothetical protein
MTPPAHNGQTADSVAIRFECDGKTLDIVDTIERRRYTLSLSQAGEPEPTETDSFRFPVDDAVSVETASITLPTVLAVYVRNTEGTMLSETTQFRTESFPTGAYVLELCAPMKLYIRVDGPLTIRSDMTRMKIEFSDRTAVTVGARSKHDRPATTVTTTDRPKDVMAAISSFGAALKTTSPERSYPTLRGHPPMIERGETLSIPDELTPPETGVRIEIPETLGHAFCVAPLAYYLGATIEPGDDPKIHTDSGFSHPLEIDGTFESEVERVLKQTFFLDCVTRTEGLYPIDLHERRAIASTVDLDFEALYEEPIGEQLAAYLSVPYSVIEPHVPEWKLTSHVESRPTSIEMLPFLVNDLAVIRTPDTKHVAPTQTKTTAIEGFLRNSFTRSTREAASTPAPASQTGSYVEPTRTESLEQAWVGDETPIGASKATPQAYRNRLARGHSTGDISITVVCNDTEMAEERDLVDDVYGSREELPFEITAHKNLTRDELRTVLETDVDFLHYIGHIEPDGFECANGKLDAAKMNEVGVDAFLLNGCQSYDQGMALIDGGAIGGIVTLSDVINTGAVKIGSALARLLNNGFPLRAALEVAKDEDIMGGQYIVVGDGGMSVTQVEGGTPTIYELEKVNATYEVTLKSYVTTAEGMGSLIIPNIDNVDNYYLNSGTVGTFSLSKSELLDFLYLDNMPIQIKGCLYWSDEISVKEIN